jgi:subtilisin family serine protease
MLIAENDHLVATAIAGLRLGRDSGNTYNVTLSNTILSNNVDSVGTETNCARRGTGGTLNDGRSNLLSNNDCSADLLDPSNIFSTDPDLADTVPTDNGGQVLGIALMSSSAAIDAGYNTNCSATDYRGEPRPVDYLNGGSVCDIGPYEMQL